MSIAVAYWCLFAAALLPYVWVGIAKAGARGYDNRDPRGWMARQDNPRRARAYSAHLNAFEAFPLFVAGVIAADVAGVPDGRIVLLSVVFITARLAHGLFYLTGHATLRSLAWLVGLAGALVLLAQAANTVG